MHKTGNDVRRHKLAAIFFTLALLAILASIPWPALPYGRPLLAAGRPGMPLALSFVIPLYNSAATIASLVHDIEALTVEGGHEVILVNDGSADATTRRLPRPRAHRPDSRSRSSSTRGTSASTTPS